MMDESTVVEFEKFHGTGNDFIMLDNRNGKYSKLLTEPDLMNRMMKRHFGIGADGLISISNMSKAHYETYLKNLDDSSSMFRNVSIENETIEKEQLNQTKILKLTDIDFYMEYFNADGKIASLCGNGCRCAIDFANKLGILKSSKATFLACDGPHFGEIDFSTKMISVTMADTTNIVKFNESDYFVDTGSPHYVRYVMNLDDYDVLKYGAKIRNDTMFIDGTNANFIEVNEEGYIMIRTYERGVENETLSCGTGAVAAALVHHVHTNNKSNQIVQVVKARGGMLTVKYDVERKDDGVILYSNITLSGPAEFVYKGEYKA